MVSNRDDTINSRDVITAIQDLESQIEDLDAEIENLETELEEAQEAASKREARIEELESQPELLTHQQDDELATLQAQQEKFSTASIDGPLAQLYMQRDDLREELHHLQELEDQCTGYMPDWRYGVSLIRDSYFKEHAQEVAREMGDFDPNSWPGTCVDWEQAANELQQGYTAVEFDGVTYWGQ